MHVLSNTKGPVQGTDKKSKKNHQSAPSHSDDYHEDSIESSVDGPDSANTTNSTHTDLTELAEKVTVSSTLSDVVPQTLPMDMRSDLSSVKQKDVEQLYNVKESVLKVKEGRLSQAELVVLHWRSYRNILIYELSDFQELQMRFLRFFSAVFADVVELCYPTPESRQGLVSGCIFQHSYICQLFMPTIFCVC